MTWPWVSRGEYDLLRLQLSNCQRLGRYWAEECERADEAYRRLELRLIAVRGELAYERERRARERIIGIVETPGPRPY